MTTPSNDNAIQLNLTPREKQSLINDWINQHLRPESIQVMEELLTSGEEYGESVANAVLNDAINDVLEQIVTQSSTTSVNTDQTESYSGEQPSQVMFSFYPERLVWVTFRKEGVHRYPAAGVSPALATGAWDDVSFLAHEHRHVFHFKVGIEVNHTDRDVEFIQFKRDLERQYVDGTLSLDNQSCEMISDNLAKYIQSAYPGKYVTIEVSEDGENGSYTTYPAQQQ